MGFTTTHNTQTMRIYEHQNKYIGGIKHHDKESGCNIAASGGNI